MDTSLYVANESIMAVTGSAGKNAVTVQKFQSVPLPTGSVINGIITDERAFTEAMGALREQMGGKLGNLKLVLGSSQIYTKRGVVPKLPRKKVLELVVNEFSDVDSGDDELIYDYAVLGDLGADKGNAALLCAVKKSLVAAYADLLGGMKLHLTGMSMTHEAFFKLARLLPKTRESTFILLDFDGNTLDAILFVSGEFRFSNRTRLIAERGTAESAGEILRVLSSLIQFNASERSGQTITNVYLVGAVDKELPLAERIHTSLDLPTEELTDTDGVIKAGEDFRLSAYACAVGNLI